MSDAHRTEDPSAAGRVPFRALVENGSDCSILLDARLNRVYVSPSARRVFGYDAAYLTSVAEPGPLHRDDVRLVAAKLHSLSGQAGSETEFEYRLLQPDGSVRWYSARCRNLLDDPAVRAIVVNSWDITERRRAEIRLQSSEALFRAMVENSSDMVKLLGPDGLRLYVSPASVRVCGYEPDELKDMPMRGLLSHPDDRARTREALQRAIRHPAEVVRVEYRMRDKSGNWRWIEADLQSRLSDPHLRAIVCNARDISEHKRLESRLEAQAESLRQMSRRLVDTQEAERKALSRELHDRIGQALALVNAHLQILRDALVPDQLAVLGPRLDDCRALVSETVNRTRDLMADLRPAVLDDFGLATALRSYARQFSERTGLTVVTRGMDSDPAVAADVATALYRVVQEALSNAAKHSRASRIELSMAVGSGRLSVEVDDDGVGFDQGTEVPAEAPRSWGLVIMAERMEAVGGTLRVTCSRGAGTRVTASAPIAPPW